MLSKETKELLKHFVDLQQNATEQQKTKGVYMINKNLLLSQKCVIVY